MTRPVLWTDEQISAAVQAHCTAPFAVSGVSIDTRSLEPGDLFVALPGSGRDGHDFVEAAFTAGATAALVCRGKIDPKKAAGPLVEVDDVLAALEALARAARARSDHIMYCREEACACRGWCVTRRARARRHRNGRSTSWARRS